jgi:tetratricopeptide (TPR) repeat protein
MALAQNAIDEGNIKAGCEFYEAALHRAPNHGEVLEAYGEIMLHYVQNFQRAEQLLRHSITVAPNEGYIKYMNLAQLLQGQEALKCYQQAYNIMKQEVCKLRTKKSVASIHREMAGCLVAAAELYLTDLCDDDDAEKNCEEALEEALKHCCDSVEVHQTHASLRLSQQREDDALIDIRKAVLLTHKLSEEYQPTYESKIELGRLFMQVHPPEAFQFFLDLLQLNDANPYVWFLLGECARLRKRFHDSARLLKHARQLAVYTNAGEEATTEIDTTIRLLVEEMGGEQAVMQVQHMNETNPLDFLDPEENPDEIVVNEGDDNANEEWAEEPLWEDAAEEED